MNFLIHLYKLENDPFVKLTKLNQSNFEKQRVSLTMNVFNKEILAALESNDKKDAAVFFHAVTQILVHDLEPKKMAIWIRQVDKT